MYFGETNISCCLSIDNILYDKTNFALSAVIDFDFGHIGTSADDFFRSLGHTIGRFPASRGDEDEVLELQKSMLNGFPVSLPPNSDVVEWMAAKTWDDHLRNRSMKRPGTIQKIEGLAELFWLSSALLPFRLCNEVVVSNSTPEQLSERKKIYRVNISKFLDDYGF